MSNFFVKEGELLDNQTWIPTRATRSHSQWDHGKHERHFQHGQTMLPELWLYQGNTYWKSFCLRIKQFLDDKVNYAFSLAFSISPTTEENKNQPQQRHIPNVVSDNEGDDSDDEEDDWYSPTQEEPDGQHQTKRVRFTPDTKSPKDTTQPPQNSPFELGINLFIQMGKETMRQSFTREHQQMAYATLLDAKMVPK